MFGKTIGAAAVLAMVTCPAFAHAMLEKQFPRAGEVLAIPPTEVHLSFSEGLKPTISGVDVTDASGKSCAAGKPRISGQMMDLKLKPLRHGHYHVAWHAISVDGHRTQGGYGFTVK